MAYGIEFQGMAVYKEGKTIQVNTRCNWSYMYEIWLSFQIADNVHEKVMKLRGEDYHIQVQIE